MHIMKETFETEGFSVSINDPYAGGFIMKIMVIHFPLMENKRTDRN